MNTDRNSQVCMGQIPGIERPVSRLFFGTARPPVSSDDSAASELLDSILSCGINAFDCARSYGKAENALGKWMESRKCREKVVLLTKCGDIRDGVVHVDRHVISEQLQQSLEALRTGHIDIYLLHRYDPDTPVEEYIDTLNEHQKSGKIRVFGVSNWSFQMIEKANCYAASHGLSGFSVSSPNYGLTRQMKDLWGGGCVTLSGPEKKIDRDWYSQNQMPVIAYSSLGRGFFSGRFKSFDYEGARSVLDPYAQKGYLYDENMRRLQRAEQLAGKYGISVPEVAMRYIFSSTMNVFAVVSSSSPKRLQMNIRAADTPLTAEDVKFLEEAE